MNQQSTVFIHRKTSSPYFDPRAPFIPSTFEFLLGRQSQTQGVDWSVNKYDVGSHFSPHVFEKRDKTNTPFQGLNADYSFVFAFDEEMVNQFGNRANFEIEGGQLHPERRMANLNQVMAEGLKASEKIISVNFLQQPGVPLIPAEREALLKHMLIFKESEIDGGRTERKIVHCGDSAKTLIVEDLEANPERIKELHLMSAYLGTIEGRHPAKKK